MKGKLYVCKTVSESIFGFSRQSLAEEAGEESTSSAAAYCVYRFHLIMKCSHAYIIIYKYFPLLTRG